MSRVERRNSAVVRRRLEASFLVWFGCV